MESVPPSLLVSAAIFLAIALRGLLPAGLRIWHVMVAGAALVVALGEIGPREALRAVDWNVLAYLFGVFAIAAQLYDSGASRALGERLAASRHPERALLLFVLGSALCAALLTNDAAAVVGTPIALLLARSLGWPPALPLIALCASVTVGSMASPVGNPQNILIASRGGLASPILDFALWLGPPCLASLAFLYAWLRFLLRRSQA